MTVIPVMKPTLSEDLQQIILACTICTEMSGNGAWIVVTGIPELLPILIPENRKTPSAAQARTAFYAGAVGAATRRTAVRRFGTATVRFRTGSTASASASPSSQWIENGVAM